jgi:hypothetical protein
MRNVMDHAIPRPRMVLPAGSVVEGHIAEIGGVAVKRRIIR